MSPDIFKEYGSSEHIQEIHTFLEALNTASLNAKINIQTAIHIRDYIILTLYYTNSLRTSNVITITLKEVSSVERDKETKEAFIFKSEMYKVSLICRSKIILASKNFYHRIKLYLDHLGLSLKGNKH